MRAYYKARFVSGKRAMLVTLLISIPLLFFSNCSCDVVPQLGEATDKIVAALNKAIDSLTTESAAWRVTVDELKVELSKIEKEFAADLQSTLTNEVSTIAERAIAASGTEFRCDTDFIGQRVRQELIRMRARYTGESVSEQEPALCHVVPLAVDTALIQQERLKWLEFYGYDFDISNTVRVLMIDANNEQVDVTSYLQTPTHYHMTLNLGANGVQIPRDGNKFVLSWNGRDISDISIVQPPTELTALFNLGIDGSGMFEADLGAIDALMHLVFWDEAGAEMFPDRDTNIMVYWPPMDTTPKDTSQYSFDSTFSTRLVGVNGIPVLYSKSNHQLQVVAEAMARGLQTVGIKAYLQALEPGAEFSAFQSEKASGEPALLLLQR